jgi:hypothetical protein
VKKGVCYQFQTGKCKKGDKCKWLHANGPAEASSGVSTTTESNKKAKSVSTDADAILVTAVEEGLGLDVSGIKLPAKVQKPIISVEGKT